MDGALDSPLGGPANGALRFARYAYPPNELGYCVTGEPLVTVFADSNRHSVFSISAGQMFFVPSGALHAIENVGGEPAEAIIAFSDERPQDFGLSGSVGMLTPNVMGNAWGLAGDELSGLPEAPAAETFAPPAGAGAGAGGGQPLHAAIPPLHLSD